MSDRPAPLSRTFVERMMEIARSKLAENFGVTHQVDHNGAWGPMGKHYVTVRFANPNLPSDMIEVMMEVVSVSSSHENAEEAAYLREDK